MDISCKWNGNFRSNRLERTNWRTSEGFSAEKLPFGEERGQPEIHLRSEAKGRPFVPENYHLCFNEKRLGTNRKLKL